MWKFHLEPCQEISRCERRRRRILRNFYRLSLESRERAPCNFTWSLARNPLGAKADDAESCIISTDSAKKAESTHPAISPGALPGTLSVRKEATQNPAYSLGIQKSPSSNPPPPPKGTRIIPLSLSKAKNAVELGFWPKFGFFFGPAGALFFLNN
jgi:hypothetical protein